MSTTNPSSVLTPRAAAWDTLPLDACLSIADIASLRCVTIRSCERMRMKGDFPRPVNPTDRFPKFTKRAVKAWLDGEVSA